MPLLERCDVGVTVTYVVGLAVDPSAEENQVGAARDEREAVALGGRGRLLQLRRFPPQRDRPALNSKTFRVSHKQTSTRQLESQHR